ncbi:MAG: YigZ family protein [Lachnospiraceae bacterium]|nr:YigZ family protein [Lachnospiraceae bacterium]
MIIRYLTIYEPCTGEYTDRRSRFIAHLAHAENEAEALAFIAGMKNTYRDARHNCSAFIVADAAGGPDIVRSNDDGEPSQTAGKPMLDVLQASGLRNIVVVVTRYFGGILLGTGGLVRAYSQAVSECLKNADPVTEITCTKYALTVDYNAYGLLTRICAGLGADMGQPEFSDVVKLEISVPDECTGDFLRKIRDAWNGKLIPEEAGKGILRAAAGTENPGRKV